jgi:hypothetical protein
LLFCEESNGKMDKQGVENSSLMTE